MHHMPRHRGLRAGIRLILSGLLAPALLHATCEVTVPGVSVEAEEEGLHVHVPGLDLHLEPGRIKISR